MQLEAISSCPTICGFGEQPPPGDTLLAGAIESIKVHYGSPFLQAKYLQLPQLLLIVWLLMTNLIWQLSTSLKVTDSLLN